MTETLIVRPGQVWEDLDPRSQGRTIHVDCVDGDHACVTDNRGRKTRIKLSRLRPVSNGYRLIKDTPERRPR